MSNFEELGIPVGIFDLMRKPKTAKAPAKDTREFFEKYSKKTYTTKDAGRVYLLSFLFDAYQHNSGRIDKALFDVNGLRNSIRKAEDIRSFDSYYYLTEWLRSLYENAVAVKNDLILRLSEFNNTATSLLSAENIRNHVKGEQSTAFIIWLNSLTLEAYQPQEMGGQLLISLRESIGQDIRYLKAYHAFLYEVADFTGIPEVSFLKVRATPIVRRLAALNAVFKTIRDNVAEHREPEVREAEASAPPPEERGGIKFPQTLPYLSNTLTNWTPDYLEATMRSFEPIGAEAPVPEERIQFLRDTLRRDFETEFINWYGLYHKFSMGYRNPHTVDTLPDPKLDKEITEAIAHEG